MTTETAPPIHWKKLTNTKYFGSQDIPRGEDLSVTIESIATEMVKSGGFDGKPLKEESCIVAQLKDNKPLILNKTNCKTIAIITGSNYIDDWKGKSFTLFVSTVRVGGDVVDAVRIRNRKEDKNIVSVDNVVAGRSPGSTAPKTNWLHQGTPQYREVLTALKNGKTTLDQIKRDYNVSKATEAQLITDFK